MDCDEIFKFKAGVKAFKVKLIITLNYERLSCLLLFFVINKLRE